MNWPDESAQMKLKLLETSQSEHHRERREREGWAFDEEKAQPALLDLSGCLLSCCTFGCFLCAMIVLPAPLLISLLVAWNV